MHDRIYRPWKYGPPLSNTMPENNLVTTNPHAAPPRLKGGRPDHSGPFIPPGSGDDGWFVNSYYPQWAGNIDIVQPSLEIPANIADASPPGTGAIIYAPTNKQLYGCLELTVIYWRLPGATTTTRQVGWYDWCAATPQWQTVEDMNNQAWANSYITTGYWEPEGQNEAQIYWTLKAVAGTNCWQGLLFNWPRLNWEQKAYSCGAPSNQGGWSMWESYYVMDYLSYQSQCPTIPRIDASVAVYTDTIQWRWIWLDQANISRVGPYGLCWTSGYYYINMYVGPSGIHVWRAFTP